MLEVDAPIRFESIDDGDIDPVSSIEMERWSYAFGLLRPSVA